MSEKEISAALLNVETSLCNNALFKLSLGSKELFHSNFLESILGIDDGNGRLFSCKFFKSLGIEGLDNITKIETDREKEHIDIILRFYQSNNDNPVKTLIIENKVKSVPDLQQLLKYKNDIPKKFSNPEFILISLIIPGFSEEKSGWRHFNYGCISCKLEAAKNEVQHENKLPEFGDKIQFETLVDEYCAFTKQLALIGSSIETTPDELYTFFNGNAYGIDFRKLKIHDLVLKIKYQQIEEIFKKEMASVLPDKLLEEDNYRIDREKIYSNTGFTNSQGLFDIKIYMGDIEDGGNLIPHFLVVQLQGDQLRYGSFLLKKRSSLNEEQIKKVHKEVVKGLKDKWFNNNILGFYNEKNPLDKGRKGDGRAEKGEKPGYDKFDHEFYFRYDTIVKYLKEKKNKKPVVDISQKSIGEIIRYFNELSTHIFKQRTNIKGEINSKSSYKYLH